MTTKTTTETVEVKLSSRLPALKVKWQAHATSRLARLFRTGELVNGLLPASNRTSAKPPKPNENDVTSNGEMSITNSGRMTAWNVWNVSVLLMNVVLPRLRGTVARVLAIISSTQVQLTYKPISRMENPVNALLLS